MFKKLKQKINEEQSPQRSAQSPQQAKLLAGMIAEPAFLSEYTIFALDHSKQHKAAQVPSARVEPQSTPQKPQKRTSLVESPDGASGSGSSLLRSGSRESLTHLSSWESLTSLVQSEGSDVPAYDPPSDTESEAEDALGNGEVLSKEQLLHRLHRVEKSLANYKGKYSELVTAYRTVQRDKEKTQAILSQSQDKALRRIGELREELQMDQQAKKHLQEQFDAVLEEKEQMINVLQTQVALLKKRPQVTPGALLSPEVEDSQTAHGTEMTSDPLTAMQLDSPEQNGGSYEPGSTAGMKDVVHTNKEQGAQLSSEMEALQQQLQERLQEMEKLKELHTTEKTKLITQLRDAKNLIEQLEQDKGMVIAETKRQMHETLEMKEEEIVQLRAKIQQTLAQKEELQEQREKAEKAAFEELEQALGVAQRAEEARRQLQARMEEQLKQVEQANEEERRNLQQELSRVKQEVVTIMKKSTKDKIAEMEQLHSVALAKKDEEINAKINQAVEECREELLRASQEKEQQALLELEESELQKNALHAESEAQAQTLQTELECARTRILELESSLAKYSQEETVHSDRLSEEIEEQKKKSEAETVALEEKHAEELKRLRTELTETLNQQHHATVEELMQKHNCEIEAVKKDKEDQFQASVEDMNQKMLEKLNVKQAEIEALSAELNEVQKSKQQLEEKLAAAHDTARQELQERLKEEEAKYQAKFADIKHQHETSVGQVESTLKDEIKQLKSVLQEKDKELEEQAHIRSMLEENTKKSQQDIEVHLKEIEDLRNVALSEKEVRSKSNDQVSSLQKELKRTKSQVKDLEKRLEKSQKDCQQKGDCLKQKDNENEALHQRLQQTMNDLSNKEKLLDETSKAVQEERTWFQKQLDEGKGFYENRVESLKKEVEGKLKSQEVMMEKVKQKAEEMQKKFKKRLHEQEAALVKKERELELKDQQIKSKVLEMAQENSEGLRSTVQNLEANYNDQLEKLQALHKNEQKDLLDQWQQKLVQQAEEMEEKHSCSLKEKMQELEKISQQLLSSREDKEQLALQMKNLGEEISIRESTVEKLHTELREALLKLESVSEEEKMLKNQVQSVEHNLNEALTERDHLKEQLHKTEETSSKRLQELSEELQEAQKRLNVLEVSRCNESEDLQRMLEEKAIQLQTKEDLFQKQLCAMNTALEQQSQCAQAELNRLSDDVCSKVDAKVKELQSRLIHNQKKASYLKNVILTKNDKICTLEKELQQTIEERHNLKSSLDQMALELNVSSENVQALTSEKESLQKVVEDHSQVIADKALHIDKIDEENRNLSEKLKANILHMSNLESAGNDLRTQLANSLTETKETISLLNEQHSQEAERQKCQMQETVEKTEKELKTALEQVNMLRNKLSMMKKKAESKATQDQNTIKSLQSKIEDMGREIASKDERLQSIAANTDSQYISKSEMDQVLSEKQQQVSDLTIEMDGCRRRIKELEEELDLEKKECERLVSELQQERSRRESEKMELVQQLQEAQEQSSQRNDHFQKAEEKIHCLESEIHKAKEELESQQRHFENEKADILKAKDEALKASQHSAEKLAELKKKAEHKISLIRKQLTSQIEEKEQNVKALQVQLSDISQKYEQEVQMKASEENGQIKEEISIREEHTEHQGLQQDRERLGGENSLHTVKHTDQEKLTGSCEEEEKPSKFRDLDTSPEKNSSCQTKSTVQVDEEAKAIEGKENPIKQEILEVQSMSSEIMKERHTNWTQEDWKREKDLLVSEYETKLLELRRRLEEKENPTKAQENIQREQVEVDGGCHTDGSENDLQSKLGESENKRQKIHKDFVQLQKELRSLRKEHEKDLEYLRKEMAEESEKKLKLEIEDMEIKHNFALKQLMREFNNQMSLKEKEHEVSMTETFEKSQSIEAELMESHKEEASHLKKIIAQKEEDLKNTVQRYETVLQSREEEMGNRVWEIRKELEELQQRSVSNPQNLDELQVQLAEKTTLLSEARLKEQEYQERIHALEDQVRGPYKKSVVTHLGTKSRDPKTSSSEPLSEPTEFEYLRKVMFEYMMGRETKTMAKVITSVLKFPPEQTQKVLEQEDSRVMPWLR